jgi:hypothetical protein
MEVLQEAPNSSTFVPLSEHQSATPASFYSGPPVLHYHSGRCKVVILERDLNLSPALTALARETEKTSTTAEPVTNGNGEQGEEEDESVKQKVLGDVDVWVTSEYATFLVRYIGPKVLTLVLKQAFPVFHASLDRSLHTISYHFAPRNPVVTSAVGRQAARRIHAAHLIYARCT